MPRTSNFYYRTDPMPEIANGMVRAIFGDPEMAAKQQQLRAEMDLRAAQAAEARAHGGLYTSQTTGQDGRNRAAASLPDLIANLAPPPLPPPPSLDDPNFVADAGPSAPRPTADEAFRAGLPGVVAAMAQMDPNGPDPRQSIGTLASFLGGDEMARRGIIAQGNTPGENFALTPQRADQISARDAGEEQAKDFGVARINHASDIPVANIRRDGVVQAAGIGADSRRDVATIKATGPAPSFSAITAAFPGVGMNSGARTPEHNREVGGVSNSNHIPGMRPGVQAYDIEAQPGMTIDDAAAKIEAANGGNVRVVERIAHRAKKPDGTLGGFHWHFALENVGGPAAKPGKAAAAPKPPKPVSKSNVDMIDAEIKSVFDTYGITLAPLARQQIREQAIAEFQKSGNVVGAVQATVRDRAIRRNPARWGKPTAPSNTPPVEGARKAPDGNWYVQTGKKPDGSPAYSRVGG